MRKCLNLFALALLALLCATACSNDDEPTPDPVPAGATVAERINRKDISAADIPMVFAAEKVTYHSVATLNWRDTYPYLPQVDFAIAHNGSNMLVHYRVTEKRTVATMDDDLSDVYKESCCELFCKEQGDDLYYNIESNCLGAILMQCGAQRADREVSTKENLAKIDRWASLGRKSLGIISDETHWELALVVPVSAFWCHQFGTLSGKTFLANVYNCVGSGDDRQYVTWHPVETPSPDFHRPEYFRPVYFK